jgi:hypothetical protein
MELQQRRKYEPANLNGLGDHMSDRLAELHRIVGEATELTKDFAYSADLGCSELMHGQRRGGLQLLLLNISQRINALNLAKSAKVEVPNPAVTVDQIARLDDYLRLAQDQRVNARERWEALENIKAAAERIIF